MQTSPEARLRRLPCAFRPGSVSLLLLFAASLALIPSKAQAGANRIFDQSASGTGQSAAFTAQADDPSAVYFNPAGMTQLRGVQTSNGVLLIGGSSKFRNAAGQTAKSNFDGTVASPPPLSLYYTVNLKDVGVPFLGDLSAGFGVITPFGTLIRWPNNGPFAGARTFSAQELIDFKPTLAYKINDQISIGLGADVYTFLEFWGEGHQERHTVGAPLAPSPPFPPGTETEINGEDTTAGFNVSLLYTPFRNDDGKPLANIGLVYRSQATAKLEGEFLVGGARLADAEQTITLPQIFTGGIALWPIRNKEREWKLELDVDYTGWKSIRNLDVRLSNGTTLSSPQNWRSTYTVMVGTEYKFLNPHWLPDWDVALRAGYWNSQTPIPDSAFDPEIPDADNHSISIGLGVLCKDKGRFFGLIQCGRPSDGSMWRPKEIGIDAAFQVLLYEPRNVSGNVNPTVNGDYKTTFYVGQINVRVNF